MLTVAGSAAAATSPADVYHSALRAVAAQRSVHYVSSSNIGGNRVVMVGDGGGIQRITDTQGGATGHVTVIVVSTTAYVRGDSFTLQNYMGLTAAQASRYAGRWFFVKPPSQKYAAYASAVRLDASWVDQLAMPAPYRAAAPTTIAGKHVSGVASHANVGGQAVTVSLYVGAGSPLPVAQVATASTGGFTTVFGQWNKPVAVAAPKGAVAFG